MKKAFVTKEKVMEIVKDFPTPFHIYDEKGIRENAQRVQQAFSWNKGFREYFAVKANPNPYLINILKEYGCAPTEYRKQAVESQLYYEKRRISYWWMQAGATGSCGSWRIWRYRFHGSII